MIALQISISDLRDPDDPIYHTLMANSVDPHGENIKFLCLEDTELDVIRWALRILHRCCNAQDKDGLGEIEYLKLVEKDRE